MYCAGGEGDRSQSCHIDNAQQVLILSGASCNQNSSAFSQCSHGRIFSSAVASFNGGNDILTCFGQNTDIPTNNLTSELYREFSIQWYHSVMTGHKNIDL